MAFKDWFDYDSHGEWDEDCDCSYCKKEKENTMSIDFNKPVYTIVDTGNSCGVYDTLDKALKAAAQHVKSDRNGDDHLVMQSIKRVSIPITDATVTDITA